MQRNHTEKFDIATFRLFVFQPDEKFYSQTFEEKLALLEVKIIAAKEYLISHPEIKKSLFVAPEYLFKDMGKQGENKYYSHAEKKKYKALLTKLSEDTDIIIAPGTICWRKESKKYDCTLYRNMIYFFHRGKIEKYKKTFPHPSYDYDYREGENKDEKKMFCSGIDDALIKNINGISIGVEICYDHVLQRLKNENLFQAKIDIHLVVANGVANEDVCPVAGAATFVKVEKLPNDKFSNFIGTMYLQKNAKTLINANLEKTMIVDLDCYKLSDPIRLKEYAARHEKTIELIEKIGSKINSLSGSFFLSDSNMKKKALNDLVDILKNKLLLGNDKETFTDILKTWKKMLSKWQNVTTKEKWVFNNDSIISNHRNILFSESQPGKLTETEKFIDRLEKKYVTLKL